MDQEININGWTIFNDVERPHAAIVYRDPLDKLIKGVRYQITSSDEDKNTHRFTFEKWSYKARGPIEHQTFLSFYLKDRMQPTGEISKYISGLRLMNKHIDVETDHLALNILKCAVQMIERISLNDNFDVDHTLKLFHLAKDDDGAGYSEEEVYGLRGSIF